MKLVPLYNKLIVELLPEAGEMTSSAGLILVGKTNPYYRGKVTGVGKGHYQVAQRISMDVNEGDIVIFLKNSGMAVDFDSSNNPTKIVLADTDIYAVETEE